LKKNIYITGSTGFVGKNIISYFNSDYNFNIYNKFNSIKILDAEVVLHFAGIAHDLKKSTNILDYYKINTDLTKNIFDNFCTSNAKVFIFLSSVKAVSDNPNGILFEDVEPNPLTHYGKSKLLAEDYILSKPIIGTKKVYILRPCMIHGPGNKGNLNLLYNFVKKGLPWPLAIYNNKRSYCSIGNLCFIINELINRDDIPSGIYNIADKDPISTNELIKLISLSLGKKYKYLNVPNLFIKAIAKIGNIFNLPFNSENIDKLTNSYVVSNSKLLNSIGTELPIKTKEGLILTFKTF